MKIAYILAYCRERNGFRYTRSLVRQVVAQGYVPRVLVDGVNAPYFGCATRTTGGVGNTLAMRSLQMWAATSGEDAILLEDDIELQPGGLDRLRAAGRSAVGVCVVYGSDIREMTEGASDGVYEIPVCGRKGHGVIGTQAVYYAADTLSWLAQQVLPREDHALVRSHVSCYGSLRNVSDVVLSALLSRRSWRAAVLVPSICRHVGYESACFPGALIEGRAETRNVR